MDDTSRQTPQDPTLGLRTQAAQALAQAVASRICHDLVSPVGAINNGVDLLAELGGGSGAEEVAMIGQSAERSAAVLAFHRLAFGAGDAADAIARSSLGELLAGMLASNRVAFVVEGADGPALQRSAARLAALAALSARGLLGMRGTVRLSLPHEAQGPIELAADGMVDPAGRADKISLLRGEVPEPLDPRSIEFVLCPIAAAMAGRALEVEVSEGQALLRLVPL